MNEYVHTHVYVLPAIEDTLIMVPPSLPYSLLMCSSAK